MIEVIDLCKTYHANPILKGINAGDHPPITPAKVANKNDLKGNHWNLYECICNNYFASISPPIQYDNITYKFEIAGLNFEEYSSKINNEGFLLFQPFKKKNYIKSFKKMKQKMTIKAASYMSYCKMLMIALQLNVMILM